MDLANVNSASLTNVETSDFRSLCLLTSNIACKSENDIYSRFSGGKMKFGKKKTIDTPDNRIITGISQKEFEEIRKEAYDHIRAISQNGFPDFNTTQQIITSIAYKRRIYITPRDVAAMASLLQRSYSSNYEKTIMKVHPIFKLNITLEEMLADIAAFSSHLPAISRNISVNYDNPLNYMEGIDIKLHQDEGLPSLFFVLTMLKLPGLEDLLYRLDYTRFVREVREGRISREFVYLSILRLSDMDELQLPSHMKGELLRIKLLLIIKAICVQFREGNFNLLDASSCKFDELSFLFQMDHGYDFDETNLFVAICKLVSYTPVLVGSITPCKGMSSVTPSAVIDFHISKNGTVLSPSLNTATMGSLVYDLCGNKVLVQAQPEDTYNYEVEIRGNLAPFSNKDMKFATMDTMNSVKIVHANGLVVFSITRYEVNDKIYLYMNCPTPCAAKRVNTSYINVEETLDVNRHLLYLVGAVCLDINTDNCGSVCETYSSQNDIIGTIAYVNVRSECGDSQWLRYKTTMTANDLKQQVEFAARADFEKEKNVKYNNNFEEYKDDSCSSYNEIKTRIMQRTSKITDLIVPTSIAMNEICTKGMLIFYSEGYEAFAKSIC